MNKQSAPAHRLFEYPSEASRPEDSGFTFAGFTVQHLLNATTIVLRHWLIVTIFVPFNAVLMWVYRKRPEVQPCET